MSHLLTTSRKWFSIIIALGSIGVLMIIVVGMVQVFLTEMKLSRYQYDSIISTEQAEWAFEYAMLKVANHRDGFQDSLTDSDPDQTLFHGSTPRTEKNTIHYTIEAQSKHYEKTLTPDEYLIFPLFVWVGKTPALSSHSENPESHTETKNTQWLKVAVTSWDASGLSWSIVGMSGGTNVSLVGSGIIDDTKQGTMRLMAEECFDNEGNKIADCTNSVVFERLPYFYDKRGTVKDFFTKGWDFSDTTLSEPYFLVYNSSSAPLSIDITSDTPFALPNLIVTTEAQKWKSVQRVRFESDKSRYYDALKYSVYDKQ
jgi:hypothetical protein